MQKKTEYPEYTQQRELTVVDCISVVCTKNKDVRCVLVIKNIIILIIIVIINQEAVRQQFEWYDKQDSEH